MIILKNYELFIDKRTSKSGKEYYALYIKLGDIEELVTFIHKSVYDSISNLSK